MWHYQALQAPCLLCQIKSGSCTNTELSCLSDLLQNNFIPAQAGHLFTLRIHMILCHHSVTWWSIASPFLAAGVLHKIFPKRSSYREGWKGLEMSCWCWPAFFPASARVEHGCASCLPLPDVVLGLFQLFCLPWGPDCYRSIHPPAAAFSCPHQRAWLALLLSEG